MQVKKTQSLSAKISWLKGDTSEQVTAEVCASGIYSERAFIQKSYIHAVQTDRPLFLIVNKKLY